jgi:hypothetical protein
MKRSSAPARNQKRLIEVLDGAPKGDLVTDLSRREPVTQQVFFDALEPALDVQADAKIKKTSTSKSIKPT